MAMETTRTDGEAAEWRLRGRTTIELRRNDRGTWLATQRGVAVDGRGETAAAAVAAYCRALDRDADA